MLFDKHEQTLWLSNRIHQKQHRTTHHPSFWVWAQHDYFCGLGCIVAAIFIAMTLLYFAITEEVITFRGVNPDSYIIPSTITGIGAIGSITAVIVAWNRFQRQFYAHLHEHK